MESFLYKQFQIHYSSMAVSVVYSIKKPQICLKVRKVRDAKHLTTSIQSLYPGAQSVADETQFLKCIYDHYVNQTPQEPS